MDATNITALPVHISLHILSHLNARDLCALGSTCRHFRDPRASSCSGELAPPFPTASRRRTAKWNTFWRFFPKLTLERPTYLTTLVAPQIAFVFPSNHDNNYIVQVISRSLRPLRRRP